MFLATTHQPETYQHILTHPVWQKVLQALPSIASQPIGQYEIDGQNIFAMVQEVATVPRAQGVFEAHQQYIDLHYCLIGEEIIEWLPVSQLLDIQEQRPEDDVTLYAAPPNATQLHLKPHDFAIFLPADAHMPKLTKNSTTVKKIVVKIKYDLLEP